MQVIKKLIKYNFTPNANTPVYLVVHDTGNPSAGANAEMHYRYFNEGNKNASAHYFVDDTQIVQTVEHKDKSWHCGDGANKYGINNGNSIGIEICINSNGDYNKAVLNSIELVANLMITLKIPLDKVVRHYDASRKNCPQTMNVNGDWSRWNTFKSKVLQRYNEIIAPPPVVAQIVKEVVGMFKDEANISLWAKDAVDKLGDLGIVKGDNLGNFNPRDPISREAMAVIIVNVLKYLGKV